MKSYAMDEAALVQQGGLFFQACRICPCPPLIVYLKGPLGAGKTTWVRGFLHQMGHVGAVKSPTFTLVEPYAFGAQEVFHFDLYRLESPEEVEYIGLREYLHPKAFCMFEWPEKGEGHLPQADVHIEFLHQPQGRQLNWRYESPLGQEVLIELERQLD